MPQLMISLAMLYQPGIRLTLPLMLSQPGNAFQHSNLPTICSCASCNLFTTGGRGTPDGGIFKKDIYIYSPITTSWVYISDLSEVLSHSATVAILSSTEILVIGGEGDSHRTSIVYKGTLHLEL